MYDILEMLAFTVLIVGQFAAVIAVHSWRETTGPNMLQSRLQVEGVPAVVADAQIVESIPC